MSVVTTRNLQRRFGECQALRGVSLDLREGELYGLLGPDGAGKTSLLRIIAGVLLPSEGEVAVFGKRPSDTASGVRELVGYMPQRYSLYGDLSIGENLRFFGDLFGISRQDFDKRTDRLLKITQLVNFRDRRADALSGGMYKKLALSCALLHEPRLFILDEPTNGVDPVSRAELWDLLSYFCKEGMTILVSTSYMDEALRCTRVGLLHEGKVLVEGKPGSLVLSFRGKVYRVSATGNEAERLLAKVSAGIIAVTPLGRGTRVVVTSEAAGELVRQAEDASLDCKEMTPTFEDLFLELVYKGDRSDGDRH